MKQIIYLLLIILTSCNGSKEIVQTIYFPSDIFYIDYKDLSISFEVSDQVIYFESLERLILAVEDMSVAELNAFSNENVFMVYIEDGNVFFEYAYNFPGQDQVTYVLDGTDESLDIEVITNTLDVFYGKGNYYFTLR